jgi:predicted NBD/HSP70 family sugar kinase
LQRSTVSKIADDLIASRWIKESGVGFLPRGRRPNFLQLNDQRVRVIGISIQPAVTTIGVAALDFQFVRKEAIATTRDLKAFQAALAQRLKAIMAAHPDDYFEAIGIAVSGRLDRLSQRLVFAPHLPWDGCNLKQELEAATGLPVEIENTANACASAEISSGKYGEGVRNLLVVSVSEGIQVGMVLNGQMVLGRQGLAGEFGHVCLDADGPVCACGGRGCWESFASNTAAVNYYAEFLRASAAHPARISFENLLKLAAQNDARAREALHRMALSFGAGLAMLVTGLAPDVIVIVGEVTRAWPQVGEVVNQVLRERVRLQCIPRVIPSEVEADLPLRGAVALALQKCFGRSGQSQY